MPLPIDQALYTHWEAIIGDVRRMLTSEEGISLRDAAALPDDDDEPSGFSRLMPEAFLDLGGMLREPKDLVFDVSVLGEDGPTAATTERLLRGLLGNGYQTKMRPSPLVGRLRTMKQELTRGSDTLGRKLRYLLWLN